MKQQRLAALEAGAWDYVSVLLNPEELTLKVDAMARLKLEMERTLEESAVDPGSGLYTLRGLERRAGAVAAGTGGRRARGGLVGGGQLAGAPSAGGSAARGRAQVR